MFPGWNTSSSTFLATNVQHISVYFWRSEELATVNKVPKKISPGKRWTYSNAGDILLINNYDQPLLQLKGQQTRGLIERIFGILILKHWGPSAEQTGRGWFWGCVQEASRWEMSPAAPLSGNVCRALTLCPSGAMLLWLPVMKTSFKIA